MECGLGQSAVHFHAGWRGRNHAAVRVVVGMGVVGMVVVVVVVMVGVALMAHLLLLLLVQHLLVGLHRLLHVLDAVKLQVHDFRLRGGGHLLAHISCRRVGGVVPIQAEIGIHRQGLIARSTERRGHTQRHVVEV